jgi:predicted 3-demethylubiquinone-9 3-methyltransferase (glyoxalase superfamily)
MNKKTLTASSRAQTSPNGHSAAKPAFELALERVIDAPRGRKFTPCLWFDDRAEEAARFYVSVFKDSKILSVARYGKSAAEASGKPRGSVMTVSFELEGQRFLALNGGPQFAFSPAISLMVNCRTQREIDELWGKLSADPEAEACGWLKDKFGVSWQIVPAALDELTLDKDPRRAERAMAALVKMKKLDLAALQAAAGAAQPR